MNKYDYYVYLAICEASLETFKGTNFVTYTSYCKSIGTSFKTNRLSSSEKKQMDIIWKEVDLLFSMTEEDTANYIVSFFDLEDWLLIKFEKVVRMTKRAVPITGY